MTNTAARIRTAPYNDDNTIDCDPVNDTSMADQNGPLCYENQGGNKTTHTVELDWLAEGHCCDIPLTILRNWASKTQDGTGSQVNFYNGAHHNVPFEDTPSFNRELRATIHNLNNMAAKNWVLDKQLWNKKLDMESTNMNHLT